MSTPPGREFRICKYKRTSPRWVHFQVALIGIMSHTIRRGAHHASADRVGHSPQHDEWNHVAVGAPIGRPPGSGILSNTMNGKMPEISTNSPEIVQIRAPFRRAPNRRPYGCVGIGGRDTFTEALSYISLKTNFSLQIISKPLTIPTKCAKLSVTKSCEEDTLFR